MSMQLGSKELNATINVTPLVDVMLVLMIIFMVITPMLQRGKAVMLPQVAMPEKQNDDGKDLVVSVEYVKRGATFDFNLYLGQGLVDEEGLRTRLADELRKDPGREIYLKGDQRLTYGAVRKVMQMCHESGFQQVKLATEEIKTKEGA
ncbi:MAG TPA: biopolymer transporter ExbD [Myxococcota bacterium]|nr:biopolymer transporter ExbD [Myxococcota bacterium]HRY92089.1 biopolymer transporter ExbD [Myxococcota bacterium]HSA22147.1 biopolymer transporter ExbD [Myxococcota bacterium]